LVIEIQGNSILKESRAMTNSKKIAGLVGPTLIAVGAANLINLSNLRALIEQASHDAALIYVSGILLFVAGLAIVRAHNHWRAGWPVIVTLLGWLFLLGGLSRMLFVTQLGQLAGGIAQSNVVPLESVVVLAIGAFLSFKAYTGK
jgi:hypothetical protein